MQELGALEKEVWGLDDRDLTPLSVLIATKEVGAILIGAFEGDALAGFVYGFVGYENERLVIHSQVTPTRSTSTAHRPRAFCIASGLTASGSLGYLRAGG